MGLGLRYIIMKYKGNIRIITVLLLGAFWLALASSAIANSAPRLQALSRQYVLEGQRLELDIAGFDDNGDKVTLWVTGRPVGAQFTDFGNGTARLVWTPEFSGPNSSENSPFTITVWASDGVASTSMNVDLVVLNNNRPPVVVAPSRVDVQSGQNLEFSMQGSDPDGDPLVWNILNLPSGAGFNYTNGLTIDWPTAYADSGLHTIAVELTDHYGGADTAFVTAAVAQTTVFAISVDTVSGYPGEFTDININLNNLEPVSGFDLLVNYDASSMALVSVTKVGTRSANFEYFTFRMNYRSIAGDVNIVGIADPDGNGPGVALAAGDGPVATLKFMLPSSSNYGGFALPINFVFRDILEAKDNTMTANDGTRISQSQIKYTNGYALIKESTVEGIGDINLNGIAYEIGDAIYLTNFLINPAKYPLNAKQRLNSDVNRDGLTGTVADLVYLILKIVNPGAYPKPVVGNPEAAFALDGDGLTVYSPVELGAVAVTLELVSDVEAYISSDLNRQGLLVKYGRDGRTLRVLVYSDEGQVLPSGLNEIFKIENNRVYEIKEVQVSSVDGQILAATTGGDAVNVLPSGFILHQNYPNPFNPATEIKFDLPYSARVEVKVFNVLGQEITILLDRELPSGSHSVIWDGRDGHGLAVSSGIYFYRLEADGHSISKKMILIK